MKLYYYKDQVGNFGDELNPWLWYSLAPELFDEDGSSLLVGIGTLVNNNAPAAPRKLVFGAGVGYGSAPASREDWQFYCVRGPLSAQALGLDRSLALSDPAVLLTEVMPKTSVKRTGVVSFMPHHASLRFADWRGICKQAGIHYIDPAANVHEVVFQIRQSRLVLAEAMHLAIVADAFRVPWVPVACYDHILRFKWDDWCQSLDIRYEPVQLARVWDMERHLSARDRFKTHLKRRLKGAGLWSSNWSAPVPETNIEQMTAVMAARLYDIANSGTNYLSDDSQHHRSIARLMEKLELLKRDVRGHTYQVA
jgi:succinoglycan biosynthesis protein ExoV